MTPDLSRHPYFETFTDPDSGVMSHVLTHRVAELQQSFYFTNPSVSGDGRWLWMYASFPPARHRRLAVVSLDPDRPLARLFEAAACDHASPMVAPAEECGGGTACYFTHGPHVYVQGLEGKPRVVCTLGQDYLRGRELRRLATHLTLSADGRYFLLDGEVGNHWFVAVGDRTDGRVRVIKEMANNHNHGQFSPVDARVFMLAHDHTYDPITGRRLHFDNRIWLMDTEDSRYEGLTPDRYCKPYHAIAHEWWTASGKVCYVDYDRGVFEVDPVTRRHEAVWPEPLCHAHCDASARWFCADESPYKWAEKPCEVLFRDRLTGKRERIVSGMPPPRADRGIYHIDPHPQVSPDSAWVVYTTTVRGEVDVALSPLGALQERTA